MRRFPRKSFPNRCPAAGSGSWMSARTRTPRKGPSVHLRRRNLGLGRPPASGTPRLLRRSRNRRTKQAGATLGWLGPRWEITNCCPSRSAAFQKTSSIVGYPNGRPRATTPVRLGAAPNRLGARLSNISPVAPASPSLKLRRILDPPKSPTSMALPSLTGSTPSVGGGSHLSPGHHHPDVPLGGRNRVPHPFPGLGADRLPRLRAGKSASKTPRGGASARSRGPPAWSRPAWKVPTAL